MNKPFFTKVYSTESVIYFNPDRVRRDHLISTEDLYKAKLKGDIILNGGNNERTTDMCI